MTDIKYTLIKYDGLVDCCLFYRTPPQTIAGTCWRFVLAEGEALAVVPYQTPQMKSNTLPVHRPPDDIFSVLSGPGGAGSFGAVVRACCRPGECLLSDITIALDKAVSRDLEAWRKKQTLPALEQWQKTQAQCQNKIEKRWAEEVPSIEPPPDQIDKWKRVPGCNIKNEAREWREGSIRKRDEIAAQVRASFEISPQLKRKLDREKARVDKQREKIEASHRRDMENQQKKMADLFYGDASAVVKWFLTEIFDVNRPSKSLVNNITDHISKARPDRLNHAYYEQLVCDLADIVEMPVQKVRYRIIKKSVPVAFSLAERIAEEMRTDTGSEIADILPEILNAVKFVVDFGPIQALAVDMKRSVLDADEYMLYQQIKPAQTQMEHIRREAAYAQEASNMIEYAVDGTPAVWWVNEMDESDRRLYNDPHIVTPERFYKAVGYENESKEKKRYPRENWTAAGMRYVLHDKHGQHKPRRFGYKLTDAELKNLDTYEKKSVI